MAAAKSACINDIIRRAMLRCFAKQTRWRWLVVASIRREPELFVIPNRQKLAHSGILMTKPATSHSNTASRTGFPASWSSISFGMDDARDRNALPRRPRAGCGSMMPATSAKTSSRMPCGLPVPIRPRLLAGPSGRGLSAPHGCRRLVIGWCAGPRIQATWYCSVSPAAAGSF